MKTIGRIISISMMCLLSVSMKAGNPADTTTSRVYLVGNAHFDSQWRWTVRQSISEFLPNTLCQNFKLFDEFPEYVFNFESACKYAWMKEYYPALYESVKEYVRQGRWHLSGSTWDANDTNIPSVESAFRNVLLGQEFFKREFGMKSYDIMLPDCFGFSWTLPSVASHCGIIGFSTQKLSWRTNPFYADGSKIPFELGMWKGVDGSSIMAAMNGGGYGWNPREDLVCNPELQAKVNASSVNAAYRYFGTRSSEMRGDRGGSPLPRTVRHIINSMKQAGPYEIRMATSDEIFKDYSEMKGLLPVYDGELLMDVHATGCYTSNARMKALNRRNEQLVYSAEAVSAAADWTGVSEYPGYAINDASKRFIWHQFHDDLTGTSIPEAYTFSYNDELVAQNQFSSAIERSVCALASQMNTDVKGTPLIVYNPASVRNREPVTVNLVLPEGYVDVSIRDSSGHLLKSQVISRNGREVKVMFASDAPPLSLAVYDIRYRRTASSSQSRNLKVSDRTLENSIYRLRLDDNGDICSVYDKRSGKELVAEGRSFSLAVFEENTSDRWPSWEILKQVVDKSPVPVDREVRIIPELSGGLMASLRVERKYGDSEFVQRISLTDGAEDDRIDVYNEVDWKSERTLLKVAFPVSFGSPEATYDLGLGHVRRGNNTVQAYEVCAYQWADMTAEDGEYGVYFMSDCKYGWDKPDDNTLRLTLLHTPTADGGWFPHEKTQDIGRQEFTWSICAHKGPLDHAYASAKAENQNIGKMAFLTGRHPGALGSVLKMAESTSDDLMIKCLKKAEDGDGYIVRLYEMSGRDDVSGKVVFPAEIASAEEVNGIEEFKSEASFSGNALDVKANHFAPVTYRVRLKPVSGIAPAEEYRFVRMPYNNIAITSDAFCSVGQMDSKWRSYAAEIIPDTLVFKGVPFIFGEADYANAVKCSGQKLRAEAGSDGMYILLASAEEDGRASFTAGSGVYDFNAPCWSGFFGQCGWYGHIRPYMKDASIAYVGTHRHNPQMRNEPYQMTYMYMIYVPLDGSSEVILPDDRDITVFAATSVKGKLPDSKPVTTILSKVM
ncbi:MAG: alpha-mannosidase [Candidatus Cryptobacteroides sp.]